LIQWQAAVLFQMSVWRFIEGAGLLTFRTEKTKDLKLRSINGKQRIYNGL
jgi:hypothetical protein